MLYYLSQVMFTVLIMLSSTSLVAASFNCAKASTAVEKTICNNPELSSADGRLGKIYSQLSKTPELKQEQRNWLNKRNQECATDSSCLLLMYQQRIAELSGKSDSSMSVTSSETKSLPSANDWLVTAQQDGFTVLLQKDFKQNQQNKRMVIHAKSTDQSHASGASLRGVVLVKQGKTWQVESATSELGDLGSYGQPPEAELIKIGLDQYGVLFKTSYTGQGVFTEHISIITAVGKELKEVFSLDTSEDNSGACDESSDCYYSYKTQLEFVPGHHPDYFDIKAITKGDVPSGRNKRQVFSFTEGQYQVIANSGENVSSDNDNNLSVEKKSEEKKNDTSSSWRCGAKRSCNQMSSCAEAEFYLNTCGLKKLDRDNDGIPCENVCQ